ncbi:MAG: glycosyl hydrolase family 31, partial [Bacteroidales bacterium]|nr:glycosyl hydrolase family 31 [Bacteroidales bacterium]
MKRLIFTLLAVVCLSTAYAQRIFFTPLADNALRVRYAKDSLSSLPDWIYLPNDYKGESRIDILGETGGAAYYIDTLTKNSFDVYYDAETISGDTARLLFTVKPDEYLFGLGQFQDGFTNLVGLPRRLTQVNTQISVPMIISNKGYGVIWNNYAETYFNLPKYKVSLTKSDEVGEKETVNVTSTEGGKKETRQKNIFQAQITVDAEGDYSILLDVGQKMARRHNLAIDGKTVIEMQNLWLPPTASAIVHLTKGTH